MRSFTLPNRLTETFYDFFTFSAFFTIHFVLMLPFQL